ncbi:hypothetical protein VNI00_009239 [Paramarasmius palmivorus]|uniref:Cytochrome P450 n=1 Tax=Paramarasmius palmivorus TaxID=297713 RepID=A0AAW0CTR1_9AGAR
MIERIDIGMRLPSDVGVAHVGYFTYVLKYRNDSDLFSIALIGTPQSPLKPKWHAFLAIRINKANAIKESAHTAGPTGRDGSALSRYLEEHMNLGDSKIIQQPQNDSIKAQGIFPSVSPNMNNIFILGLALTFTVGLLYFKGLKVSRLPPGPKGYPLVGNALQLDQNRPWHTFVEWKRKYGEIVYFRLFNQDVILLNSARVAGDLLCRRASNYSGRSRLVVADYITGGLFVSLMNVGAMWRSMRRASHEAINVRVSSRYNRIQLGEAIRLAGDMLNDPALCDDHIHRFTASSMVSIIYNKSSLESHRDPIISSLDEIVHAIANSMVPGRYLVNHLPFLEALPNYMAKWKRDSQEMFRAYSERYLSMFLEVKEKESAITMGWLVRAMIAYPEAQKKAQDELDLVVGRARVPTHEDMKSLPYIRAIVKEVDGHAFLTLGYTTVNGS